MIMPPSDNKTKKNLNKLIFSFRNTTPIRYTNTDDVLLRTVDEETDVETKAKL